MTNRAYGDFSQRAENTLAQLTKVASTTTAVSNRAGSPRNGTPPHKYTIRESASTLKQRVSTFTSGLNTESCGTPSMKQRGKPIPTITHVAYRDSNGNLGFGSLRFAPAFSDVMVDPEMIQNSRYHKVCNVLNRLGTGVKAGVGVDDGGAGLSYLHHVA